MKLLNLWPQDKPIAQPKKRLLLEMLLALLAVIALVLSLRLWFDWHLSQVNLANQKLQSEWLQLNQSRAVEQSSGAQVQRVMRQLLVGQLDWMGDLPQWLVDGRVHWVSAKFDDNGLKLVGVASDEQAINAMLEAVRARYPNPPVRVSELANITLAGQSLWRFEMYIAPQTLHNKVDKVETGYELSSDTKLSAQELSPPHHTDTATGTDNEPLKSKSSTSQGVQP